jgi:hypothetical protein
MKVQLKQLAAALVLSSSLLVSAPAFADEAQPSQAAQVAVSAPLASFKLNDNLQVQVLGVLNDKNSSGVKLGAAVRIINSSSDTVRIPDHELRLKTADGTVYTLPASAGNVHGVQGLSEVDLTYMKQIDRQKEVQITDLSLVDVNYDVYPKQETTLVSVPVGSQVWNGSHGALTDKALLLKWGQSFSVPTLESPLTYTPVSISKSFTNQGATYLVKLLVVNPSEQTETVPMFEIDGKTESNVYAGGRVETEAVTLDPGEKKYIHFAINTDMDTQLDSLNVLTLENFAVPAADGSGAIGKAAAFGIGQLNIALGDATGATAAAEYQYDSPIAFDPYNDFVNPDLQVSLVELHATETDDNGYKTAIAKLKLVNNSAKPIPMPALQTELANDSGNSYSGSRQAATVQSLQPGTSSIVSYAFVLPTSDTSSNFSFKLQGTVQASAAAPAYRSTIATLPVSLQGDEDHSNIHLYPFTLNIKSWILTPVMMNVSTYAYKLHLDMDLTRDPQVVLDSNFSNLKFELVDGLGRSLGSQSFPFTGAKRLVSGDQSLIFTGITSDQGQNNLSVRVSESIMTPNGEASRVIAVLQP